MNNTQIVDAQKINVVMPMYNLIEYSNAYSKTSRGLEQCYRDETVLNNNGNIMYFSDNCNNSPPFKFRQKITGQTENGGTNGEHLKYL